MYFMSFIKGESHLSENFECTMRKIVLGLKGGICTDTDLDCAYDMNSFGFKLNSFLSYRPGGDPHY